MTYLEHHLLPYSHLLRLLLGHEHSLHGVHVSNRMEAAECNFSLPFFRVLTAFGLAALRDFVDAGTLASGTLAFFVFG